MSYTTKELEPGSTIVCDGEMRIVKSWHATCTSPTLRETPIKVNFVDGSRLYTYLTKEAK